LSLVKFEVKLGGVFDVKSLVDFRLPLFLERVEIVKNLLVLGAAIKMGDEDGGVAEVGTNVDSSDGNEGALQRALPADETSENAAN